MRRAAGCLEGTLAVPGEVEVVTDSSTYVTGQTIAVTRGERL